MTTSIWDDPDIKPSGDFVSFIKPGDTVTGRILSMRRHQFDDGTIVALLRLDTADGERTLTAGQLKLKAALAEQRPEPGDTLTVTFTSTEQRAGGKTLKHFDVDIVRAGVAPPPSLNADTLNAEAIAALVAAGIALPA